MRKYILILFTTITLYGEKSNGEVVIKCATIAPEKSDWVNFFKNTISEVEKMSGVKIILYTGGAAGDEPEIARKIKEGSIDCFGGTGYGLGLILPFFRVLELPLLLKSYEEFDYLKKEMKKFFDKISDEQGFKFLWFTEAGFINIFSKVPIRKVSEIEGKNIWVWKGDPIAEMVVKSLQKRWKLTIIPLPITELPKNTEKIDIIYFPPYGIITFGLQGVSKYMIKQPLIISIGGIIIRKDAWQKIPDNLKEQIEKIFVKNLDDLTSITRKNNENALKVLLAKGLQINEIPQSEVEDLKRSFEDEVWKPLIGKLYPSFLFMEVLNKLAMFRSK